MDDIFLIIVKVFLWIIYLISGFVGLVILWSLARILLSLFIPSLRFKEETKRLEEKRKAKETLEEIKNEGILYWFENPNVTKTSFKRFINQRKKDKGLK